MLNDLDIKLNHQKNRVFLKSTLTRDLRPCESKHEIFKETNKNDYFNPVYQKVDDEESYDPDKSDSEKSF